MFRIGDFSRLGRVTIKALRHYDETGLLRPAHVDPHTGYRYYSAAQLQILQRILLLKDLGFTLEEIAAVGASAADNPQLLEQLAAHRGELSSRIAQDQLRMKRLDAFREHLCGSAQNPPVVLLQAIPEVTVYSIRERVAHLSPEVQSLFEAAEAQVAKHRARTESSPFLLFHDVEYREDDVDVEVCIPIDRRASSQLTAKTIPGAAQVGCATYRGAYAQTPILYEAMLQWMDRAGLRIAGPLREVYHRFGADQIGYSLPAHVLATASVEFITELQVPVMQSP